MDTNRIKKFATEARNKLKAGIAAKITTLGFDKNGNVPEHMHPQLMQGGSLWNGQLQTEGFYHQWQALYKRVQQKGIKEVYEEAAYTWFNRLVAIRILMKNQLIEPVLEYVDAARTPRIVDEARMGRIPQMQERQRQLLMELLDDDSKTTEQFAILVTALCHDNPILFKCFGAMSDYTELLLPNDILTEGGFIDLLNHTEFITDADFHSPELIGWLYQFYISERKDEVFAKKGKFEADEIPAATQIFTPNWIVKYMVQNTIGRIYLDNHPEAAADFVPKWKYLVEQSQDSTNYKLSIINLESLLVGDLACGSGHILNECFDLLYDLYIYEGYSRREAVEYIFTHNLRGIDLDTRAKQLATFALMLKACQKDSSFADAHILPKVLNMPTPIPQEQVLDRLKEFFRETPSNQIQKDLTAAFELMQDADSLGSIMKFDLAESTQLAIRQTMDYWQTQGFVPEAVEEILPAMELILTLTDRYSALVMNPPYMGSGNMNKVLSNYVKSNYSNAKSDLFSVFMDVAIDRLSNCGKYGMINMHAWMFLSSFENLRRSLLDNYNIDSLLHLGPRTFDELGGEVVQNVAFVISKATSQGKGVYYRLVNGRNCMEKENIFLNAKTPSNIIYSNVKQTDLEKISGCPLAYWLSDTFISIFDSPKLNGIVSTKQGTSTGDNDKFLRNWFEVSKNNTDYNATPKSAFSKKWYPATKGGSFRKWYGNNDFVVDWLNGGENIKNCSSSAIRNKEANFREALTWTGIGDNLGMRYCHGGFVFLISGKGIIGDSDRLRYVLGCCCSKVATEILKATTPSLSFEVGYISNIPIKIKNEKFILSLVDQAITMSKEDWDAHETSWDFEANPLVALRNETVASGNLDSSFKLSAFVEQFETIWEERFNQLHQNEEELNRQFIDIYGLQNELSPEVPFSEITILQQGEISIIDNE